MRDTLQSAALGRATTPSGVRFAAVLFVMFLAAKAAAADWPMFRGSPALLGAAAGNLPPNLKLVWSYKTAGPVKSSAAVVGGRVYFGSGDQHCHAVELGSGKKIWATKVTDGIESSPHGNVGHPTRNKPVRPRPPLTT